VYFGERASSELPAGDDEPLALDQSIWGINSPAFRELSPREGVRRICASRDMKGLRDIRGYFALAWWDREESALYLAVDHLACKSLYFCRLAGRLAFASEYKAFFALPDFVPDIDPVAMQHHQALRIAMPWRPSLANVEMVRSGTVTRLQDGHVTHESYWKPLVNEADRPVEEAATLVRKQLSRTIADQTRSSNHVGISLSAGIDSAIVAGCVREVKDANQVSAYSVGYHRSDPELVGARQVADYLAIDHDVTLFDADDVQKYLPEMVWLMEDCTSREETLLHLKMFQSAGSRESLMLHGVGADVLFGGMPRHKLIALSMRLPLLRRPLGDLYQLTQSGQRPSRMIGKALAWAVYRGNDFPPPRIANTAEPTTVNVPQDLNRYVADHTARISSLHYLEPMAEQNEFDFRSPFLDPDTIDLALSIPMRQKSGWLKQKMVLRRAFDGLLPEDVRKRRKTIHRLRHDVFLSDALDGMVKGTANLEHIRERNLVDPGYIERLQVRKRQEAYETDRLYRLWTIVSLEIWLRQFADGGGHYWQFPGSGQ
jgi:asparagine synthase (glutamine-hydrolysing)